MADAKVIPFDDDRDRGRGGRAAGKGGRTGSRRRRGEQSSLTTVPETDAADGTGAGAGRTRSSAGATAAVEAGLPSGADGDGGAGHTGADGSPVDGGRGIVDRLLGGGWERKAADGLAFLRRRVTGDYEVDDFGYDEELTDQVLMSMLRPVYEKYFRVEVRGVENIPDEGGALIVANHSGTLPLDGLMMQVAVHDNHPAGRHLRLLGADLVFMLPVVNELARKAGHTLACAEDAERLLDRGQVVGVMPEGF